MTDDNEDEGNILTSTQRCYLHGEGDIDEGHAKSLRSKIRDRVNNTVSDFGLIFEHLDDIQRRKSGPKSDSDVEEWRQGERPQWIPDFHPNKTADDWAKEDSRLEPVAYQEFQTNLVAMLAVGLYYAEDLGMSGTMALSQAIEMYLRRRPEIEKADVSIDIDINEVEYSDEAIANFPVDEDDLPEVPTPVVGFFREALHKEDTADSADRFKLIREDYQPESRESDDNEGRARQYRLVPVDEDVDQDE